MRYVSFVCEPRKRETQLPLNWHNPIPMDLAKRSTREREHAREWEYVCKIRDAECPPGLAKYLVYRHLKGFLEFRKEKSSLEKS